jgi:hypothetical protein
LLPRVRGIVTNIQKLYKRLTTYRSEAQAAAGAADNGGGGIQDGARYAQLVTSFTNDLGELDKLGVADERFWAWFDSTSHRSRRASRFALLAIRGMAIAWNGGTTSTPDSPGGLRYNSHESSYPQTTTSTPASFSH